MTDYMKQLYSFKILIIISGFLFPLLLSSQNMKGVEVINETNVNSEELEFSPTFYEDGIVFISTRKLKDKEVIDKRIERNTMSIFLSRRGLDGVLKTPDAFSLDITTKLHEGPLTFDKTAENLYFTRNDFINGKKGKAKDGITKLKIYTSEKKDGKFTDVRELPFSNSEYDVCHPSVSIDGDKIYFSSNMSGGYGGMDLYYSQKVGGKWGPAVNLGPLVNTDKNDVFPFIHADGTLFFASSREGGKGGLDIYFATPKGEGLWEKPKNLGEPFNSGFDDFGLIVDLDMKNGYFSSNRSGGKGGDDIYSYHKATKIIEEAVEEGDELLFFIADKTSGNELEGAKVSVMSLDDAGNIITDDEGNIVSLENGKLTPVEAKIEGTDKEGKTKLKLKKDKNYVITIEKPGYKPKQIIVKKDDNRTEMMTLLEKAEDCITLKGTVLAGTSPLPGAAVIITNLTTKEVINLTSDLKGNFTYCLSCNQSYSVVANKNGYVSASLDNISTANMPCKNTSEIPAVLKLSQVDSPTDLTEGKTYELQSIYYNFNDATLRPDGRKDLDALVVLMKKYSELEIEIGSHTDSRGTDTYNKNLSQKRAENVISYLVSKGISQNRLKANGYGESKIRNKCTDGVACTEQEHQYNRRTEFKIIKGVEDDVKLPEFVSERNMMGGSTAAGAYGGAASTLYNSTDNLEGGFAVIAGSFEKEENANAQVSKLNAAGFEGCEIVKPNAMNFNRIVVKKTKDIGELKTTIRNLRGKGFPSFVLRY